MMTEFDDPDWSIRRATATAVRLLAKEAVAQKAGTARALKQRQTPRPAVQPAPSMQSVVDNLSAALAIKQAVGTAVSVAVAPLAASAAACAEKVARMVG